MSTNVWRWYVAAVVFVAQYYFVSGHGAAPNGTIYTVLGMSAVVAMIAGAVLHRPDRLAAWMSITAAVGLFLAGDHVYAGLAADGAFVAFPSTADWIYLAMYPAAALGLALLGRALAPGPNRRALVVAVAATVAAGALLHVLCMGDYIAEPFFDIKMRAVAVAYPVLDAVMFGFTAWIVVRARRTSPSLSMVALAFQSMVIGNAIYNVQSIDGTFTAGGLADLFWLAFVLLLGIAALHPSMARTNVSNTDLAAKEPKTTDLRLGEVTADASIFDAVERHTRLNAVDVSDPSAIEEIDQALAPFVDSIS